jgi:hypothetical protein
VYGTDRADCQSAAGYHPAPHVFNHSGFSPFFQTHYYIAVSSQMARGIRTYRRAYLAISYADGPKAETLDRLDGPSALKHTSLTAHLVSASGYA